MIFTIFPEDRLQTEVELMREEGLYIKLFPNGKIKRRLITILGEVPLEDTTVAEELVTLTNQNQIPDVSENQRHLGLCGVGRKWCGRIT